MMIFQPLLTNEQTTICLDFEKKRFCGLKIEKKNEILLRVHEFIKITHKINYMYLKYFLKHVHNWLNIV